MTRIFATLAALGALAVAGCGDDGSVGGAGGDGWTELSSTSLDGWDQYGEAQWRIEDGEIVGTHPAGFAHFIVTPRDYRDFELELDFWISEGGNSGVFFRCAPGEPTDTTCYEANIFDRRPDQSGRTGALVHIAPPQVVIDTEERWNTYSIRAEGERLVVVLNGETTVDIEDSTHTLASPIYLQVGPGEVRFRNLRIREL